MCALYLGHPDKLTYLTLRSPTPYQVGSRNSLKMMRVNWSVIVIWGFSEVFRNPANWLPTNLLLSSVFVMTAGSQVSSSFLLFKPWTISLDLPTTWNLTMQSSFRRESWKNSNLYPDFWLRNFKPTSDSCSFITHPSCAKGARRSVKGGFAYPSYLIRNGSSLVRWPSELLWFHLNSKSSWSGWVKSDSRCEPRWGCYHRCDNGTPTMTIHGNLRLFAQWIFHFARPDSNIHGSTSIQPQNYSSPTNSNMKQTVGVPNHHCAAMGFNKPGSPNEMGLFKNQHTWTVPLSKSTQELLWVCFCCIRCC